MPLVFVHGVNVRHGELYNREMAFRDRHFREILYKQMGRTIEAESIFNPYWGDLGASLSADAPFLPRGKYETLWRKQIPNRQNGANENEDEPINAESKTLLLDIARSASLTVVIDLLWDLVDQEMIESGADVYESDRDITALAQRVLDYSHSPEGESWLKTVKTDDELLARLESLLKGKSSSNPTETRKRGMADLLKSASSRLRTKIIDASKKVSRGSRSAGNLVKEELSNARLSIREKTVSTTARLFNEPIRALFHQQCALLIGDSFSYFSSRGDALKPAPIAERVMDDLRKAAQLKQKTGDELVVIGHSMGGVILCDIVTCYGKDIPIDVLITVGSQFPLFADLQMFPGTSGAQLPIAKPENVKHWINIFDPHDFLGYPASHMFSGVSDYHLPTYEIGASTHTNYFNRRSFYFQLARRLQEYFAGSTTL